MFRISPSSLRFLGFISSSNTILLRPHHHHHHQNQPQPQRSPNRSHRQNRPKLAFADDFSSNHQQHTATDNALQPSKLFTSDSVAKHRQQFNRNMMTKTGHHAHQSVSTSSKKNHQRTMMTNDIQDDTTTFRRSNHLEEEQDVVSQSFEQRRQPHIRANLLSESRNPLATLPSARLLKKMNYFEALKVTSSEMMNAEDFQNHGTSKEAATVRLQSQAHHEKLMFKQKTSGAENEKTSRPDPMFRCQKCFNLFKVSPKSVANNAVDDVRAIRNGFDKDRLFFNLQNKYKKRGIIVGSRSLTADPGRVNEASCPKCGSAKTESLMQYLHVKNNARKT